MTRNILFTISDFLKGPEFLFEFLKIEEKFCSPLYGQIKLSSTQEISFDQILNKRITMKIKSQEKNNRYFHGYLIECVFKGIQYAIDCNRYIYIFKFASFLHYLKKNTYFRIFPDKTIQEVIEYLLKPYFNYIFAEIQIQDKKIRNYIQHDVTDFEFLHQLFSRYNIFYFFKTTESIETIVITDRANWIKTIIFYDHHCNFSQGKKWQICYQSRQPNAISWRSHNVFFNIGAILKFKKSNDNQWVVKHIIHEFRKLIVIDQHLLLISATYENKLYALNENNYKPWKDILPLTPSCCVEKAVVIGEKNIHLQVMCPRTQNKSVVTFMRSELRQNKDLITSFVPQKNQIVLISFQAEQLNEAIVLGGLFEINQSWPLDLNQEGISIGAEESQHSLCFDKKDLIIKSSGHLKERVHHDFVTIINGEEIISVAQSMYCQCEHYGVDAKKITCQVGNSTLELNEIGIRIKSKKIFIN